MDHQENNFSRLGRLSPYCGSRAHAFGKTVSTRVVDHEVKEGFYEFNSLGYRCEEFNPLAKYKLFVCGCSYTFGTGVDYEATWPFRLKIKLAELLNTSIEEINLQNFSQVGASNNYISRTLLTQCRMAKPDFVVISLTHANRVEYIAPNIIENIGPWSISEEHVQKFGVDTPGFYYYGIYDDYVGNKSTILDLLLLQYSLQRQNIPYVVTWVEMGVLNEPKITDYPSLNDLADLVDRSRLCLTSIIDPSIWIDTADGHPGPLSNLRFADKVMETIVNNKMHPPQSSIPSYNRLGNTSVASFAMNSDISSSANRLDKLLRVLILGDRHQIKGISKVALDELIHEHFKPINETAPVKIQCVDYSEFNISQERVVRSLLMMDRSQQPEFVLLLLPSGELIEVFTKDGPIDIYRWMENYGPPGLAELARCSYRFETQELTMLNSLKRILLAQEFLVGTKIPYLICVADDLDLSNKSGFSHPVVAAIRDLIDERYVVLNEAMRLRLESSQCTTIRDGHLARNSLSDSDSQKETEENANNRRKSLLSRVKEKIKKLRKKDPNIYPHW